MTTPNPMLAELDEVVRLMDAATPGPWALEHERCGDVSIVNREHQGDGWDIATAHYTHEQPANAALIASAVNFLRTHHATLADMAKRLEAAERDAARYAFLRDDPPVELSVRKREENRRDGNAYLYIDGPELDRQIDAAIDATQEGEG